MTPDCVHKTKTGLTEASYKNKTGDASSCHSPKRHLAAIKALALVRKLAVPALQINLARKQVNVVAAGG